MTTHEAPQSNLEAIAIVEAMRPRQLKAAHMMLTAEVDGKLVRRFGEPGNYSYETEEGRFPMITIARNDHEFIGAANYGGT